MKATNMEIIDVYTNIDMCIRRKPGVPTLDLFSNSELVQMGQFWQWAQSIVNNQETDLGELTEIPEEFEWIMGEPAGWLKEEDE